MCLHKFNMALRLLTPVTGSLTATQPRGPTFHHSCPLTSVYVFLIRFVLFILCFILLTVIFEGLLPHLLLLHRDHPHCQCKRDDHNPVCRHASHHAATSFP